MCWSIIRRGFCMVGLSVAILGAQVPALVAQGAARPGFTRAICDTGAFPITAFDNRTGAQFANDGAARKLRKLIRDPASDPYIEGRVPKHGWRVLKQGHRHAMFGTGDERRISPMTLKKTQADGWSFDSLDYGCRPRVTKHGLRAETWRLDPSTPGPGQTSTDLTLLVSERNCNSGDPPDLDRILAPRIDYGRNAVSVTYFVEPPDGAQTCPTAPPARVDLELAQQLGDRVLEDGGFVAPRQRFPKRG